MKKVHLVSHTHWDREWYRPFQYFRSKLVFLIDKLIHILEEDPQYAHFMLDGQTIPLEDYLQVRPENTETLKRFIKAGRISVGPWYIQPDEFAPDAESLIRNLLIGTHIARQFGEPMLVGYLPDSFGQTGQLPHILRGFDIHSAVIMRGFPSHEVNSSEFFWEGINGEHILGIFLPGGYSNGMFLPADPKKSKLRLNQTIKSLEKWASTEHLLVLNGVDHQFPQAHIPALIKQLDRSSSKTTYQHSHLEDYIDAVRASDPDLPTIYGEMLSPIKQRVHSSIASTRIYQKVKNRRMQALLERYVEPLTSLAWLLGAEYPQGLTRQAWKILLQNQTHDGLCGCCTDAVHREMDQRFTDVEDIGSTLLKAYSRAIASKADTKERTLTVFNNAMTRGKQLVRATVYVKKKDFILLDSIGNPVPYQIEKVEEVNVSTLSIWTLYLHGKDIQYKVDLAFYVDFDANFGYKQFTIKPGKAPNDTAHPFQVEQNKIDSPFYTIQANKDGSLQLFDKHSGRTFENLLIFEDCGDAGDTYNYSPVKQDSIITSQDSPASVVMEARGPIYATLRIQTTLHVPKELVDEDNRRSDETVPLNLITHLHLYAQLPRVDITTTIENVARDHRLRILFDTGIQSSYSFAETQFGTIQRPNHIPSRGWKTKGWKEKPLPIYAQQRFVDLNDGEHGLAVLNRGLPEYEIYDDHIIAITLLRGVGMLGKPDLLIRPGRPSGMVLPTPDAQCPGTHTLEYALLPHEGDSDAGLLSKHAAEYDAPPLAVQNRIHSQGILRRENLIAQFIEIENLCMHLQQQLQPVQTEDHTLFSIDKEEILVSALKKAEAEEALILRIYNPTAQDVKDVHISFSSDIKKAHRTNFAEKKEQELDIHDQHTLVLDTLKPYSAATILLLF